MALSKTTQDHDEIRQWAEKRGAKPAEVAGTHSKGQTGILRFCFPDAPHHNDASLREIPWDEFFEKFDQNKLELIYQDVTAEGAQSNFNKLIYPEDEHAHSSASHSSASHSTGKSPGTGKSSGSHASHSAGTHTGKASKPASPAKSSGSSHAKSSSAGTRSRSTSSGSKSSSAGKSSRSSHKAA